MNLFCFFFSSRRRHTRSYGDWSSDVCSSDLRAEKAVDKLLQGMESSAELVQLSDAPAPEEIAISEAEASQRPVVRLVDLIISEGILARSSDIHIEPEEGGVAVR